MVRVMDSTAPRLQTKSIGIIGAGISGLSCAKALEQAGYDVEVFDKGRNLSGRMATRRNDLSEFDHGAQYFTAKHPAFIQEVDRWIGADVAQVWSPKIAVLDNSKENEIPAKKNQSNSWVATSIRKLKSLKTSIFSASNTATSVERFIGVPKMTTPATFISRGLSIKKETTIDSVFVKPQSYPRWSLKSKEIGLIQGNFNIIIAAIPAPQAAELFKEISPKLTEISQSVKMTGSWAVMLNFEEKVDLKFDAAFINGGPLRWIARNNSKPERGATEAWVLHATPEWSESHLNISKEEAIELLVKEFVALGGSLPKQSQAHLWRYAEAAQPLDTNFAWDAENNLGICSDWVNGGRIEGAWLSGKRLAEFIIQSLKNNDPLKNYWGHGN
ncbi:NAD(P)-binding protein [Porticoccus sp.]|nr:NAD(P)-binding protein [Porticoccus sp.]